MYLLFQFKYHIGMAKNAKGLVSFCKENNIVAEAYSPLGNNQEELIKGNLTRSIGAVSLHALPI